MENRQGPRQQPIGLALRQAALAADAQADGIVNSVQEAATEQTALLEATPLESQYEAAFAAEVEAKHNQAERLTETLENLVGQQVSRLQRTQSTLPGVLSMPRARAQWQAEVQRQQCTLQRLHGRLETVREIKDGMGVHGPRVEELATRKLRARNPALAKEWDDMREAQRQHHALLRRQEHEKRRAQRERLPDRAGLHLGLAPLR